MYLWKMFRSNHVCPKENSPDSQAFLLLHDIYICTGPSPRPLTTLSAPRSPCGGGPDPNDGQRGACEVRRMYCLYSGDCMNPRLTATLDWPRAPRLNRRSISTPARLILARVRRRLHSADAAT